MTDNTRMQCVVRFDMENEAFTDNPTEAARILRDAAMFVENGGGGKYLYDSNGNKVGSVLIGNQASA
jgi:hypothetical protein